MDDFVVREQLLAHVTQDEPPMTLTSTGLLAHGARRRRIRIGGLTGTALTAIALIGVLLYAPPSGSAPPAAALSAEAECLARVPLVPGATPDITADPLVHMSPPVDLPTPTVVDTDLKTRVTCHLVDTVPAMLPGVRFMPVTWRGDVPFEAIGEDGGLRLSARTPTGGFGVKIMPAKEHNPKIYESPHFQGTVETLPDGTKVAVVDDRGFLGGDGESRHLLVEYITARTRITVSTDNVHQVQPDPIAFGPALLTKEQLIQLASSPQLAVFG
ncbi:MAG: hypothetical protein HOV79_21835 [Hamadaea sp.]|nr:hypothetical protein [Hamadaea sp.]